MLAAQPNANGNNPLTYNGEDLKLSINDVNNFLDNMGYENLNIQENSDDYRIIKELINEYKYYENNFAKADDKLELYKKCKETIEKLKIVIFKYKDKQKVNDPVIIILNDVINYLQIHKEDNNQNAEILNFIDNLCKDLKIKDLNYVIHKYYSSSITSLLENTYDETKIKTIIKTKEINNIYALLNNNRLKINDIIIISENDNFDIYKLFILLNIQQNQKKYLLNVLNLQTKNEEQIQVTESNNYFCIIDDNNKIKGIKIGEYKK